jgi:hypothetical protein
MSGKFLIKVLKRDKRVELSRESAQDDGSKLSAKGKRINLENSVREWVNKSQQARLEEYMTMKHRLGW